MKQFLSIAYVFIIFLIPGCKSGSGDPTSVLSRFLEALSENDMFQARNLATADSKFALDMLDLAMKTSNREIKMFDIAGKEFGDAKIEGERATVLVTEKSSGVTMNYLLKKEDGTWKVSFDNNSIMNMGIDQLKELRDGRHNMDNVLDEIKHLDIDSLKKSVH